MSDGRILQVNVSFGGVPKLPVPAARITAAGVEGDRQREVTVHGGPHRAVSILGIEAIRRVAAEGHPIAPGTAGENLTIEGFDVSTLPVGTRLAIGGEAVLELSGPADPCRTIRHSFSDRRFGRLGIAAHPSDSRMYARVIRPGVVRPGDAVRLTPATDDAAERFTLASRLDRAERASLLAVWQAARAGGHDVRILDDGEIVAASSPDLPGIIFNIGLGFAHLPNLVDRAVAHFAGNGSAGWVMAEEPPFPGARADSAAVYVAIRAGERPAASDGIRVRELDRDEVGPWGEVIATGAGLDEPVARAFRDLEPHLATTTHHHRFVAEVDGRLAGAGSVHTHHGVGWLRSGVTLPAFRGRGVQRALIEARVTHAARLGCELAGASAAEGSSSARNLERVGGRIVAVRRDYRIGA